MKSGNINQPSPQKQTPTHDTTRQVLIRLGDECKAIDPKWERLFFKDLLRCLVLDNQLRRSLFLSWLRSEKFFPEVLWPLMLDYLVSLGIQQDVDKLFNPSYILDWEHAQEKCVLTFSENLLAKGKIDWGFSRTLITECFFSPYNGISFFDKGLNIENQVILRDEFVDNLKSTIENNRQLHRKYLEISGIISGFEKIQKEIDEKFKGTEILCLSNAIGMFYGSIPDCWMQQNDGCLNTLVTTLKKCHEAVVKQFAGSFSEQAQQFKVISFNITALLIQYDNLHAVWSKKRDLLPALMSDSMAGLEEEQSHYIGIGPAIS